MADETPPGFNDVATPVRADLGFLINTVDRIDAFVDQSVGYPEVARHIDDIRNAATFLLGYVSLYPNSLNYTATQPSEDAG